RRLRTSARGRGARHRQPPAAAVLHRLSSARARHAAMPDATVTLRPYVAADETAAIELWRRTWQATYPAIDFAPRLDWWRERWRTELVPNATVIVAESTGTLVGFVTLNPANGDLDQIVVAPEAWGGGVAERLLNEAKRLAPSGVELRVNADNIRA